MLTECRSALDVHHVVVRLVAEILRIPIESIPENATLDDDLQMESVAFLELQVALEDELGVQIDPVEVVERNHLPRIVEYLHSLLPGAR